MRLTLRVKLLLLAVLPILVYLCTGLYLLAEERAIFKQMSSSIYESAAKVESLILNADRDMYQAYVAYMRLESGNLGASEQEAALADLTENRDQVFERAEEAKAILEKHELLGLRHVSSGEALQSTFDMSAAQFTIWYEEVLRAAGDGKAQLLDSVYEEHFQKSRTGIDHIGEVMDDYAYDTLTEIDEQLKETQLSVFIGMAIVTVLLIVFMLYIIRVIMVTVRNVVNKTRKVSEGDLTILAEKRYSKDELGDISRSVDSMIDAMKGLISGIKLNTVRVNESAAQLSNASKESSAAAEHVAKQIGEVAGSSELQARGADEIARAIEEMTAGVNRIAENTSTVADDSSSTASQADEGQAVLSGLTEQMKEVKSVIGKLSEVIGTLEQRSQDIGTIVENITTFSNQTNILSLNASIEAARAGEHGKGFAVVADEIRKLAANSLQSAERIHQLVSMTRNEISDASGYMNRTMEEVENSSVRLGDVGANFQSIIAAISRISEQLQDNSAITEQMSASSEEVSASVAESSTSAARNMEKADSVAAATEEQLALIESISLSADGLNEVVRKLNEAVEQFKMK
ncbi:methyl-accepting chemotaxis protein [Paenibacillus sp. J5C_2022]|uniref:methyl-accepting chemotaxis protein n=1 Tax=Paenibacillus sp. J5C2022 TaxID=2977129 RepID=UPI0021D05C7A|nr:HAMP domain-containing methyl-accepting chemotaxis protein [Paenibacillus sp. J5C2022]MCU6709439.1 methyl-accepting chemotaxis protein [Paenibacillus sp. J5C2022]